jgi:bifunctional polynucleotide phosphatase/kinase
MKRKHPEDALPPPPPPPPPLPPTVAAPAAASVRWTDTPHPQPPTPTLGEGLAWLVGFRAQGRFPPPLLPPPPTGTLDLTVGNGWLFTQEGPFAPQWTVAPLPGASGGGGGGGGPGPTCPLGGAARLRKLSPAALGACHFAALPLSGTGAEGASPPAPARRCLVLDLDGTLIRPTDGKKFCVTEFDWAWAFPTVPKRVKAYADAGYKIAIFTNQAGVAQGTTTAQTVRKRLEQVIKKLGVAAQVFCAVGKVDFFRKPAPGMWWLLQGLCNGDVSMEPAHSLFVGDAAGRRGDFSGSDLGCAINLRVPFTTPEAFFGGSTKAIDVRPALHVLPLLREWLPTLAEEAVRATARCSGGDGGGADGGEVAHFPFVPPRDLPAPGGATLEGGATLPWARATRAGEKQLVLLCGPPGCGKSTLAASAARVSGWVVVNQDALKTKEKTVIAVKEALMSGRSVVVDRTHVDAASRAELLQLLGVGGGGGGGGQQLHVTALAVQPDALLERCRHAVALRVATPLSRTVAEPHRVAGGAVPAHIINTYTKRYAAPDAQEGFAEVVQWRQVWGAFDSRCAPEAQGGVNGGGGGGGGGGGSEGGGAAHSWPACLCCCLEQGLAFSLI